MGNTKYINKNDKRNSFKNKRDNLSNKVIILKILKKISCRYSWCHDNFNNYKRYPWFRYPEYLITLVVYAYIIWLAINVLYLCLYLLYVIKRIFQSTSMKYCLKHEGEVEYLNALYYVLLRVLNAFKVKNKIRTWSVPLIFCDKLDQTW